MTDIGFHTAKSFTQNWFFSCECNGATSRIFSKKRSLRAAVDFNLLYVKHFDELRLHMIEYEIVDTNSNGWIFCHQNRNESCSSNTTANGIESDLWS